jgi:hypothetical protein
MVLQSNGYGGGGNGETLRRGEGGLGDLRGVLQSSGYGVTE